MIELHDVGYEQYISTKAETFRYYKITEHPFTPDGKRADNI